MSLEIERKFLVKGNDWRTLNSGTEYIQGYLKNSQECVVRVRIAGNEGFLTVKGPTTGTSRLEFEYKIPVEDARTMLDELAEGPIIKKRRYKISVCSSLWEVDEFLGENEGLVIAEIELEHKYQPFDKPDWIGEEVTYDSRYLNSNLVKYPYKKW